MSARRARKSSSSYRKMLSTALVSVCTLYIHAHNQQSQLHALNDGTCYLKCLMPELIIYVPIIYSSRNSYDYEVHNYVIRYSQFSSACFDCQPSKSNLLTRISLFKLQSTSHPFYSLNLGMWSKPPESRMRSRFENNGNWYFRECSRLALSIQAQLSTDMS